MHLFQVCTPMLGGEMTPFPPLWICQWSSYLTNHFEEKYWWNIFKKGCSMQKGRIWGLGRKWCARIEAWYWPIFSVGSTENRLNYLPTKFEIDRTMGTHLNSILKFKIRFSQNGFLGDTPFLKRRVQLFSKTISFKLQNLKWTWWKTVLSLVFFRQDLAVN